MTRRLSFVFLLSLVSIPADAQEPAAVGSTLSHTFLRDLPSSHNLFHALETIEGEVISDRFYGGGLNTGHQARDGAFLSSWNQTRFFVAVSGS